MKDTTALNARLQRIGLLAALLVPMLTACGGGSDSPAEPPAPPPPAPGLDGPASTARFTSEAWGMALAPSGEVIIADSGDNLIRKLSANYAQVSTLAGGLVPAGTPPGHADGNGPDARFNGPVAVAVDAAGNTYVADTANHLVRKISAAGNVTTLAGQPGVCGIQDGMGKAATVCAPTSIAVDKAGTVYVAHSTRSVDPQGPPLASRIRKITADGTVSTLVSKASQYTSTAFETIQMYATVRLAIDSAGTLYAADPNDHVIRKYAADGQATVVAGTEGPGEGITDGAASAARFGIFQAITFDRQDRLYVLDRILRSQDIAIRRVGNDGSVTTLVRPLTCTTQFAPGTLCHARQMVAAADGQFLVAELAGVGTGNVTQQLRNYTAQGTSTVLIGGQ